MYLSLLILIGGVGLFLLGMLVLTDGLRALAGDALRRFLRRSTRSPVSGAVTGMLATALMQSSSATTVATVGFVGAGLIAFPQALGIIFGANIGTTLTGWLVAILGFKLQLGQTVMPLILIGVFLRMFGHGRMKHLGWVIAGFSLLFFGITAMQQGMVDLKVIVSPDVFPTDTMFGRLQLVLIGIVITLVTQSSSAGVATALAALGADAITFTQAAAMVIGMGVGTTFTAALATVGGSTATRRTGYAHVIFNVLTGVMAFLLLIPLAWFVEANGVENIGGPLIGLVAFHTMFNVLGVIVVIGFTDRFAKLMIRLVPEHGPNLTARLDDGLLSHPHAAADAAAATLHDIARALFTVLTKELEPDRRLSVDQELELIDQALSEARDYTERMEHAPSQTHAYQRQMAVIHALDHLTRLYHRCRRKDRVAQLRSEPVLRQLTSELRVEVRKLLKDEGRGEAEQELDHMRQQLREQSSEYRENTIARASAGDVETGEAMRQLDSMRWLYRVAYHLWRIVVHQRAAASEVQQTEEESAFHIEDEENDPPGLA